MAKLGLAAGARALAGAAALALGLGLAAPAHAVFLEADAIEADGSVSTVDLWFFAFDGDTNATIQVNDLGGPPVAGADPDLIIYVDDGTFGTVFAIDDTAGADPQITAFFPAGAYIAVVANNPLSAGEFGPTRADTALAAGGYDYEFNGPDPDSANIVFNCLLSGSLGGGYTTRVFPGGTDTCRLPPVAAVPEPATFALFGLGLIGLGVACRRRRA